MQIHSVGIDLGQDNVSPRALGAAGKMLVKKKFTQMQLLAFTANLQTSLIGLEACSDAHFLGRALRAHPYPSLRLALGARPRTSLDENLLIYWHFRGISCARMFREVPGSVVLVAPQGFEPRDGYCCRMFVGCPPGIRTPIERVRVASPTIEREGNTGFIGSCRLGGSHNQPPL